jgi:hypothetical protein
MSTSTTTTAAKTISLPSPQVVIGGTYVLCSLAFLLGYVAEILFTDHDPYAPEGPVDSIVSIGVASSVALAIGVGLGLWLIRDPRRARVGAILFAALSVLSGVAFWSGAPAILGACAAWQAGLLRGGRPLPGAARAAGIVGLFVVALNIVLSIGGELLYVFTR